jgi:prepilin-type N-terminal cleavage/methylation domain-containing protein
VIPDLVRTEPDGVGGFSLIEVLAAVVVAAILASAAIAVFSGTHHREAAESAARRLAADLSFCRMDATNTHTPRRMWFDVGTDRYGIIAGDSTLTHPVTRKPFLVDLRERFPGTGIDLAEADFGGSDTLDFDDDGVPVWGGRVAIEGGQTTWTIRVAGGTGRLTISED